MSDPIYGLVMAAAELQLAAPREFDGFVAALKAHEKKTKADFLAADPNGILAAQGKAQAIVQLRQKIEDCRSLKNTYAQRK